MKGLSALILLLFLIAAGASAIDNAVSQVGMARAMEVGP